MSKKSKHSYFKQSGVIPVYEGKVVAITARGSKRWIVPKGNIPNSLSARKSAAKEALEEAGIKGKVLSVSDEELEIEPSKGTKLTVLRGAVGKVLPAEEK